MFIEKANSPSNLQSDRLHSVDLNNNASRRLVIGKNFADPVGSFFVVVVYEKNSKGEARRW